MISLQILKRTLVLALILTSAVGQSASTEDLSQNLKKGDILAARAVVRSLSTETMKEEPWLQVRTLLHENPKIGWDVIRYWDQIRPTAANFFDQRFLVADQKMSAGKFAEAFTEYQSLAQIIKSDKNWQSGPNHKLFWTLIHSMARALYGSQRFSEARKVYQTIPSSYEKTRQVLFELMWTSYRENRLEYALGAIASQASGYFSAKLEPETYLLQYYIYKRMCRTKDAELVYQNAQSFAQILDKNTYTLTEWLGKDVETLVYKNALQNNPSGLASYASEKKAFINSLRLRFNKDQMRLREQMGVVSAHLNLVRGKSKELEPITAIKEISELLKTSYEKWDADDKEVWVDEIGHHAFVGENLCKKR